MREKQHSLPSCRLHVGTSGYSYVEWVEAGFYFSGIPSGKMLSVYAQKFPITELNYSWYQMPKSGAVERMRDQVAKTFLFAAKLNRSLTHEIDPSGWRGCVRQYRDGISPLVESRQLAAVLIQFPPSFRRISENRTYLAELLDELAGLPVAVEFRHVSWATDKVFAELERRKTSLVAVDAPALAALFPRLDVVTNPEFFYVRFHGRNTVGWRSGNMQKQFDYDYSDTELAEWTAGPLEKMTQQARKGYIFFNNHVRAQAPRNAEALTKKMIAHGQWNVSSSI